MKVRLANLFVLGAACLQARAAEMESLVVQEFASASPCGYVDAGSLKLAYRCVESNGLVCLRPDHGRRLRFESRRSACDWS